MPNLNDTLGAQTLGVDVLQTHQAMQRTLFIRIMNMLQTLLNTHKA